MRKMALILFPLLFLSFSSFAASDKTPKDFKLVFRSSAGALERATTETVEIAKDTITVNRSAEVVGEGGGKTPYTRTYKISEAQLAELYQVVVSSGFLTWPKSADGSHQSTVDEFFDITADGKTVTHGRWEAANQEAFRSFYDRYNSWFNSVRTARF
ncbi:MAG: hypothetical protein K8R69_12065 [Deltaproteobacteria bacterium]|nr:hypothetical protein [Deltaproteobacteria bacterium]